MKNYKILYTFILTTLLLFGCKEDEFLTEVNPNAITTDTFWQTEAHYQSALTTVYSALQFQSVSGGELVYEMILGDIGGTETWYRPTAFRNLNFNDNIYHVTNKWDELYVGIFRANQVIQNIQTEDESIFSGNAKIEIEAQAKFLRAWFYWQLAHTYNGAVMHLEVIENDEDFHKPFSSKEEVTEQIIKPDLEFAKANLPEKWEGGDVGRVTWGSATSMLGKVYLFEEDWTRAAAEFKEVIDADIYALTPDIRHNWSEENEFNEESIFEVAYSDELNPGVGGAVVDDNNFESGAEATTLARALGQLNFGAFNTLLPSYIVHEMFVYDEVDPNNSINDGNLQSKRMSASICPFNGETDFYLLPIGSAGGWAFGQSAYIKKHTNWYHLPSEDVQSRSGINFRHIRLADVYLMYAEAVLEASGDVATAIEYVDRIRTRAGVITLQQYIDDNGGKMPAMHRSRQIHGNWELNEPTVDAVMTHIRRVERPLELCYEGHRWKDLVRWGIVKEVFDELRADEVWRETFAAILSLTDGGVPPIFVVERIRPDFFLAAQNYVSEEHDYFPIPAQERQNNNMIN
ncbi:MAG: RagB/SusD family nutrient uptake outer membrane protein [Bacteroidota bacterium]